jgi:UPF0755 protein
MDGFIKPQQPKAEPQTKPELEQVEQIAEDATEKNFDRAAFEQAHPKKTKRGLFAKIIGVILVAVLVIVGAFCAVLYSEYQKDIEYSAANSPEVNFEIKRGETLADVAGKLKEAKLVRSKISFELFARLNSKTNLQAGMYSLSASMKIPEIVEVMNKGVFAKTFSVMFVPGGTVSMAKKVLKNVGFSDDEINKAFAKDYSADFPKLFAGKPAEADLEGFLYGETHIFDKGTSVEKVLRRYLRDFEDKVVELDLATKFEKVGLNLYQGITFASIVQKETLNNLEDKKMVAGVFFNRMKAGMTLGSDVTYQYICDKLGLKRDYTIDNPYNLRRYTGLTPTPIATPGVSTLQAVVEPAKHDYLFFLSGDDDKNYYATTSAGHESNIQNHCKEKCLIH